MSMSSWPGSKTSVAPGNGIGSGSTFSVALFELSPQAHKAIAARDTKPNFPIRNPIP